MRESRFVPLTPGLPSAHASTLETLPHMNRALRTFLPTAAVVAACLFVVSWIAQAWMGRALGVGEWAGLVVAGAVVVTARVKARRQRNRRKIEDMRDSALW